MSDMINFYHEQAATRVATRPLLKALQKKALADFDGFGFPTRTDEDWKYTAVHAFLQQAFVEHPNVEQLDSHAVAVMAAAKQTDVPVGTKIALVNGVVVGLELLTPSLPLGVLVLPLASAMISHADIIKSHLGRILKHEHGFHALNTAMLQNGLFIYIPADVCLKEPLLLTHWQTETNQATYLRHLVVAEKGSVASIIEDYQGDATSCYFTSTITEVVLGAGSELTHYKIQREGKLAYHVGHISAALAAGSQFNSHLLHLGGQWSRSDITVHLTEPRANCLLNGLYAPSDLQHMDQHTLICHEAPDCKSVQDYKGILTGHSRAVFNGKVVVARHAQHTEAKQQNKNLLLSKTAEIDTKPQLDIYADDVTCTHGATVGQLDEEALFYLATRGILHSEASRYLIQAFAADNLRLISDTKLGLWMGVLLNQQIG